MQRPDLLEQSAPRIELDQRSREARLRQEQVERLLVLRPLPRQSLLKRVLRCVGSRIYMGQGREGGTASTIMRGTRRLEKAGEADGGAGGLSAASPFSQLNCAARARSRLSRPVYGWPVASRCRDRALHPVTPRGPQHDFAWD